METRQLTTFTNNENIPNEYSLARTVMVGDKYYDNINGKLYDTVKSTWPPKEIILTDEDYIKSQIPTQGFIFAKSRPLTVYDKYARAQTAERERYDLLQSQLKNSLLPVPSLQPDGTVDTSNVFDFGVNEVSNKLAKLDLNAEGQVSKLSTGRKKGPKAETSAPPNTPTSKQKFQYPSSRDSGYSGPKSSDSAFSSMYE